jgi:hypothetical protein
MDGKISWLGGWASQWYPKTQFASVTETLEGVHCGNQLTA